MFTVFPGQRICYVGTSLTAGGPVASPTRGWWMDPFGWGGLSQDGPGISFPPQHVLDRRPTAVHLLTLAEIGGATVGDLLTAWSSIVTPYLPIDAFVLEGNINDVHAATNTTTFRTNVQTMLGLTGSRPVLWLNALLGYIGAGEDPTKFGDAFNTSIDAYNTIVSQEMTAIGSRGTYVDGRTPFKAWEVANNSGNLGQGLLTVDGVHLSLLGLATIRKAVAPSLSWT